MRYIQKYIIKDLQKKMVFLGGPRQVGKTTLAEAILEDVKGREGSNGLSLNWDYDDHRKIKTPKIVTSGLQP